MAKQSEIKRLLAQAVITPEEVRTVLPLSRNSVYEAIKRGDIESVRIGKKLIIPTGPLRRKLGIAS